MKLPGRQARPTGSRRRLGQHFLADPNLLELIVREAAPRPDDVALEVGGGAAALTRRLAPRVAHLHVIELDQRMRGELEAVASEAGNVDVHWADAMRFALGDLDPAPTAMVSNLPYSIATPLILRTIEELPGLSRWTLMLQREIADRLRAAPGGKAYGSPSVLVQLACEVELIRPVNRAVFVPRPRVESALIRLRRHGPAVDAHLRGVVREAFAHRRKGLARSLELARPGRIERVRAALEEAGLAPGIRAEALTPEEFGRLAEKLSEG